MPYEVEQKFPVADLTVLAQRFRETGTTISESQTERDLYFAHPGRNFAETDEALRIRRKGPSNSVTYKGPKLDRTTKTRREIDLPLPSGEDTAEKWIGLLEALGFTPVAEVRKLRRKAHVTWQNRRVECSLDEVEEVGTFVELELVVEAEDIESAKECIASLAAELELADGERRSYLELLLSRRAGDR